MSALILGNDIVVYTTSKNAGSTVRKWVTDLVTRYLLSRDGSGSVTNYTEADLSLVIARFSQPLSEIVLSQTRVTTLQLASALQELNIAYHFGFFSPLAKKYRFCVKRDPISRFISCASGKIGKKQFREIIDVEHLIDEFEYLCYQPLRKAPPKFDYNQDWDTWRDLVVARHFVPQHLTFGDDARYYNQCFDVSEVNTKLRPVLEDYFQHDIPAIVVNKGNRKLSLSDSQLSRVRAIFQRDYEIGYC